MPKYIHNNSGFTLIELGIVLSIISVLVMAAVPNFESWRVNMSLKGASRDLYSTMQEARILAIKNNSDAAVVFDTANNRYYLCDSQGGDGTWTGVNDSIGTGDNNIVNTIDLGSYNKAVRFGSASVPAGNSVSGGALPGDGISYTNNCLTVNPQGTGGSGYVYLEDQGSSVTYAVGTRSSGLVRLLKWGGGSWQ